MVRLKMLVTLLLILIIASMAYVRLAPSDPARWHRMPEFDTSRESVGSAFRVIEGAGLLAQFAETAQDWPRVGVLAGTVEDGRMTWVARSAMIGFPDYITAEQTDDALRIYSRLRFGKHDFGANAKRLDAMLKAANLTQE